MFAFVIYIQTVVLHYEMIEHRDLLRETPEFGAGNNSKSGNTEQYFCLFASDVTIIFCHISITFKLANLV